MDRVVIGPQPGPQTEFARCRADICIFGGGAYGGKTYSLLLEPLRKAPKDGRFNGVIFRRERPQITAGGGLWDTSKQIYPHTKAEPTESKLQWAWPNGATLKFTHLALEDDKNAHQGAAYVYIGFDELELFSESQFWFLWTRNRPPAGYSGKCWTRAGTNPNADSWIRELIDWWIGVDGYPIRDRCGTLRYFTRLAEKIIWVDENWRDDYGNPPKSLTFIPSLIEDNPLGIAADPSYRTNLLSQDSITMERLLRGNWNITFRGGLFNPSWFKIIKEAPKCRRMIRYWDLAATPKNEDDGKNPDWTAGALVGENEGNIYIIDMVRMRGTPLEVEEKIKQTARMDGYGVTIAFEEEHGASGKYTSQHFVSLLKGYDVWPDYVSGEKVERAKPWAALAQQGCVYMIEGEWNRAFLGELGSFPMAKRDMVDGVSGSIKVLKVGKRVWPFFDRASEKYCRSFNLTWADYWHYGAVAVNKDMRTHVLSAMYDKGENKLFVYGEIVAQRIALGPLADKIVDGMGFGKPGRIIHGLFADPGMFGEKENDVARTLNSEILRAVKEKRCRTAAYAQPAEMYDRDGSISHANLMFYNGEIVVHESCKEAAKQFSSWRIEEGKPDKDCGLCECLCLIVSVINRVVPKKPVRQIFSDPHYKPRDKKIVKEKKTTNSWQYS